MVESVVKVRADLQPRGLRKFEKLVEAEVHAPAPRACENIAFSERPIIEGVSTNGRRCERSRVEKLITLLHIWALARDD